MPRRKITKPQDLADLKAIADDLPDLTDQQMHFVEGVLAGKSASDAYRAAYDCSNAVPNTIWCAASKLANDPRVKQWLSIARQACLGSAVLTRDGHLQQLERLREIALDTGNVGAAVQAETFRGKVAGHYVERYEDVTPRNPLSLVERLAAISPALANAITDHIRLGPVIDVTPNKR